MTKNKLTNIEKELIMGSDADVSFAVLQTTNETDSIFLRQRSTDLDVSDIKNNKELQQLIQRMKITMQQERGVGLAAPQVGIGRNLFIFIRLDKEDNPIQVAINPQITKIPSELFCFEGDGCLSIPNQSGNTARYAWVEVSYYDEKGDLIREILNGGSRDEDFTGVIFQHEYDHLQGILFTDRLIAEE